MLKSRMKIFFTIFALVILLSSFVFATTNDVMPISAENQVTNEVTNTEGNDNTNNSEETPTYSTHNSDYFKTGGKIVIYENEIIDGNAYIIAEEVIINGKILGDAFIIANNITVDKGYIYNNGYILANNLTITNDGLIYHLYTTCNHFKLEDSGIIYRDLKVIANNVELIGCIGRDAFVNATNFTVGTNNYGKTIFGNLNYTTKQAIIIPEGAVEGEVIFNKTNIDENNNFNIMNYVQSLLSALLYTAIIVLLIILLAPKFMENSYKLISTKILLVIGIGTITLIAIPIIALILIFTIIGVPLSFGLITIYILAICTSTAILSNSISGIITNKFKLNKFINIPIAMLVTAVIWVLQLIPYLNVILNIVISIIGLGIILSNSVLRKKIEE